MPHYKCAPKGGTHMNVNIKQKKRYLLDAYEKYSEQIYRYCIIRVRSKEYAEEILQETFFKTWKYILSDKEINDIRPFLFKICKNLIIDHYRKMATKNKREECLEDAVKKRSNISYLSFDQKKEMEKEKTIEEIHKIISFLPPSYRDIVILRYIEEIPPREIAQILNTSAKNISAKLNRAKKKLKQLST